LAPLALASVGHRRFEGKLNDLELRIVAVGVDSMQPTREREDPRGFVEQLPAAARRTHRRPGSSRARRTNDTGKSSIVRAVDLCIGMAHGLVANAVTARDLSDPGAPCC
jgi:hypothetical protein